jgi:hypothetical protein
MNGTKNSRRVHDKWQKAIHTILGQKAKYLPILIAYDMTY